MTEHTTDINQEHYELVAVGDEQAFRAVYEHFLQLMGKPMLGLLKSDHTMRDVLQEAFLRIWLSRDRLAEIKNPGGWVRRIIMNECYRHLQKQGIRIQHNAQYIRDAPHDFLAGDEAESNLALAETKKLLRNAVSELSPRQSAIYKLSREQHKKVTEIAAELGLSDDYVKKTLATAIQRIRQYLVKAGKNLPSVLV